MILLLFFLMQVMIGYAKYHCFCVRYLSADNTTVIIGVSTAGAVLLFLLISTVVVIRQYWRQKNQTSEAIPANNNDTSMNFFSIDSRLRRRSVSDDFRDSTSDSWYNRHLPDDYKETMSSLRHLYSKRLPDERDQTAMASLYNKRLPDNYAETEPPDYPDSEHSQQLVDYNIGTTSI